MPAEYGLNKEQLIETVMQKEAEDEVSDEDESMQKRPAINPEHPLIYSNFTGWRAKEMMPV